MWYVIAQMEVRKRAIGGNSNPQAEMTCTENSKCAD